MDLFEHKAKEQMEQEQPLAARMRPRTLDEYVGQDHILAPGRLLRRAIQADQLSSLIFYGPPGTGKTTLAAVIANTTKSHFQVLNAVLSGVKDIRETIAAAQERRLHKQLRTTLFVDEVHRWNKSQQDALLPWVENGTITLIGATTENPYFSVNKALLSRSRVFQLKPLEDENLRQVIELVLKDEARGFGKFEVDFNQDAREHLIQVANGDARALLNAVELAVETTEPVDGVRVITMDVAEESIQQRAVLYDKEGDYHFDIISAFIKSIRGSDPDATLYWMAKMIYAGEDPRFIWRRMQISAAEDIGLADPNAIVYIQNCASAFERIGMPEGNFLLANAAIYLASAPKSNSAMAFFDALKTVREERDAEVPNHLRDAARDKEGFGHGAGYQYPHAFRDHWVAQQYLPESLKGRVFYNPGSLGYEKSISDDVCRRREEQIVAMNEGQYPEAPPEILTFSPMDKEFDRWLQRTVSNTSKRLHQMREKLFGALRLQRHHRILVLGDDSGLLTWEALRGSPEGGVWAIVSSQAAAKTLGEQCKAFHEDKNLSLRMPHIIVSEAMDLSIIDPEVKFEAVVGRNVFMAVEERESFVSELKKRLVAESRLAFSDVVPSRTSRIYQHLSFEKEEQSEITQAGEERIYSDAENRRTNWNEDDLKGWYSQLGPEKTELVETNRELKVTDSVLARWFDPNNGSSYVARLLEVAEREKIEEIYREYQRQLRGRDIKLTGLTAFTYLT